MEALTPAERRGALVVVCLLTLGAGHDLWRASRPLSGPSAVGRPIAPPPAWQSQAGDTITPGRDDSTRAEPRGQVIVDLNRATAAELDALPGIGPVLAARIIEHRQRHGPFRSREELLGVRGIGPRLFARIGPRVSTSPNPIAGARDTLTRAAR